ncbi:hypothetical protein MKX01_037006 [Papaver californicum]|nr:hypothetical protein MKX01_037006 [Papaver californicum]
MRNGSAFVHLIVGVLGFFSVISLVEGEDPYKNFTWTATYGTIAPLGVPQQVILINGQFPGPRLDVVTNDNLIINVINKLDEPFLLTWNGIKQRKNSWQDGVLGTNCPIPPNSNYTYKIQPKDHIGTYTYFPSTAMHRAAGGFGGLNVYARSVIPVPYPTPASDFTLLIGDWYKTNHKVLRQSLDSGKALPFPYSFLINGQTHSSFSGDLGKTYMFRISNGGLSTSISFKIQGHKMKLVECEGSHTIQNVYESLDVHVDQSLSVLVTLDQPPKEYYIVAYTPFTKPILNITAVLRYTNSQTSASGPYQLILNIKCNRPWSKPEPSVQTPSKSQPAAGSAFLATSVLRSALHDFLEIVFQNNENEVQSWHLDGYDIWVVGYGGNQWTPTQRKTYNLNDALARHTVQVYPNSRTSILMSLDNQGMWNIRSQFYLQVWSERKSLANEYDIPLNSILCGKARGRKIQ